MRGWGSHMVQKPPFNQFKYNPNLLAKEVLKEVPKHLLNWMRKQNIVPNPRSNQQLSAPSIPQYFINKKEKFLDIV